MSYVFVLLFVFNIFIFVHGVHLNSLATTPQEEHLCI